MFVSVVQRSDYMQDPYPDGLAIALEPFMNLFLLTNARIICGTKIKWPGDYLMAFYESSSMDQCPNYMRDPCPDDMAIILWPFMNLFQQTNTRIICWIHARMAWWLPYGLLWIYFHRPTLRLYMGPMSRWSGECLTAFYEFISTEQRSDYVWDPCLDGLAIALWLLCLSPRFHLSNDSNSPRDWVWMATWFLCHFSWSY